SRPPPGPGYASADVEDAVGAGEEEQGAAEDVAGAFAASGVGGEDGGGSVVGDPADRWAGHRVLLAAIRSARANSSRAMAGGWDRGCGSAMTVGGSTARQASSAVFRASAEGQPRTLSSTAATVASKMQARTVTPPARAAVTACRTLVRSRSVSGSRIGGGLSVERLCARAWGCGLALRCETRAGCCAAGRGPCTPRAGVGWGQASAGCCTSTVTVVER